MAGLRRIAICDDEIGTCSDLEKMILDFAGSRALQMETEVFYSGEAFYRSIQEQCPYDLVFLDIQLLELDGVQVGRQIREQFIRLSEANKNEFYFHAGKSVCRLYLDEIRYFACNGRKVEIYTDSGQKEFYGAMREVWKQVEGKGFWAIHKSYIVNAFSALSWKCLFSPFSAPLHKNRARRLNFYTL